METKKEGRQKKQTIQFMEEDFVKIEIENSTQNNIDAEGLCGNTNICDTGAYAPN